MSEAKQFFNGTLSEFIEQPDSPKWSYGPDGIVELRRKWKCLSGDNAMGFAPFPGSPDWQNGAFRCANTEITRIPIGEPDPWSLIESVYYGILFTPPTIVEWTSNRLDRPIEQHPDFNDGTKFGYPTVSGNTLTSGSPRTKIFRQATQDGGGWAFEKFAADSEFRGIEAYMVASGQFKVTDYLLTPDASVTGLFKIDTPPSISVLGAGFAQLFSPPNAGGNRYLKVQHDCRNVLKGLLNIWERTRVWLYFDLGWKTQIYS